MIDLSGHDHFKTNLGAYFLGDAREILKKLPSETFDAVITGAERY